MRRHRMLRKTLVGLSVLLGGSTVLDNGCINTVASLPICGTVLTFCTPTDQLNLFFPMLDLPNYDWDPSCTIPMGCVGSDLYDPLSETPPGTPGGGASEEPSDTQSGTGGGG